MTDCSNVTVRDRLPDFLNERLEPEAHAETAAHLERCAACRAELDLLRRVKESSPAPALNLERIAAGIAPYRSNSGNRWRTFAAAPAWRAAAVVAFLAVGATMTRIAIGGGGRDAGEIAFRTDTGSAAAATGAAGPETGASSKQAVKGETRGRVAAPVTELAVGGTLADLTNEDLRALLDELDNLEAVPPAETEIVLPAITRSGA